MAGISTRLGSGRFASAVAGVALGMVCAGLLWATVPLSNSFEGLYVQEMHYVRLVATQGALAAFDRGEHPEIDGYTYTDPERARSIITEWERDGTRVDFFARSKALQVRRREVGHRWAESIDVVTMRVGPARIHKVGLVLPWLRLVELEYEPGNLDQIQWLVGHERWVGAQDRLASEYLHRKAPWSQAGDLVAQGTYQFPRLELDPRFVWLPILQAGLFLGTTVAVGSAGLAAVRRLSRHRRRGTVQQPGVATLAS